MQPDLEKVLKTIVFLKQQQLFHASNTDDDDVKYIKVKWVNDEEESKRWWRTEERKSIFLLTIKHVTHVR